MRNKRLVIFGYAGSTHVYRWASSLAQRGYDVCVISLGYAEIESCQVVSFKKTGKFSYIKHSKNAVKAAIEFNPDIIHVHYAGGHGLWGMKTNFSPMVVSVWGSDVTASPDSFLNRRLTSKILKKADMITATSVSLSKETKRYFPFTNNKIKVVPFGVSIPDQQFPFPNIDIIKALYLKQLEPIYAPDILIKAVKIVKTKIDNFKLTMGGEGSMETEIRQLISQFKLEDTVDIIGFYDNKYVYNLIKDHHFLVMPSLKEGFGVAAVESFACSRPVIATNVGGIPEIITNGKNGILVNPNSVDELANAILSLISDKEKMVKMGQNSYEFVRNNYSWEKSLDLMEEVYNSL